MGTPGRRRLIPPPRAAGPSPLDLAVDLLAAYRLTRLATADVVSAPAREAVVRGAGDGSKLATLVTCRWCAGMWVAGGVSAARRWAPRAWSPAAWALALSAGAALVARLEDD